MYAMVEEVVVMVDVVVGACKLTNDQTASKRREEEEERSIMVHKYHISVALQLLGLRRC